MTNGKICYLEIPAADVAASARFYATVFGWKVRQRGDGQQAFDDTTGSVSGSWVTGRSPSRDPGILTYVMVDSIEQAARIPKATITIERGNGAAPGDAMIFSVRAEGLGASEPADVLFAVTEEKISTDVPRGENAGRRLAHSAVMRMGVRVGEVHPPATAFAGSVTLSVQPGWRRANLRVVAFVQERRSRRILGVGALPLDKVPPVLPGG